MRRHRRAKIVATLGPSSSTEEAIRELFEEGADVFRFNFSHGTHAEHRRRHQIIRALETEVARPIAILMDLQGPKLRLGPFAGGKAEVREGDRFRIELDGGPGDAHRVTVPHPEVFAALEEGADVLIDDDRGASVAVDLALLACGGVPPAVTSYAIGTRAWTEANRAAGGEPVLAPADAILAMLRTQHAALLTTTPAPGHVTHRVAFLLGADPKPWQVQACDEAKEAAARYPQLEVFEAKGVAAAVRDGAGALLMATIDPRQSLAAGESEEECAGRAVVARQALRDDGAGGDRPTAGDEPE